MNEYNLLLRIAIWIRRFRKRCGYGVHSPLAFQFITGVIYCTDPYYAYATLRQPLAASIARLDEYDPQSGLTARDLRLLFRLTNYQEPATIHLIGASPIVQAYITAARTTATLLPPTSSLLPPTSSLLPPTSSLLPQKASSLLPQKASSLLPQKASSLLPQKASSLLPPTSYLLPPTSYLIYCDTPASLATLPELPANAMVIVRGIHHDSTTRAAWQQFIQRPDVTLTFDLYRFGIILRRPKINPQNYVVNYF